MAQAPLGSSINEVKSILVKNNWKINYEREGLNEARKQFNMPFNILKREYPYVDGDYALSTIIADYLSISIGVFWGFDTEGKLIDVYINREVDGL